jgi:hypothetical protein
VFSVNKMRGSLSNVGRGFCRVGSRVVLEIWVADFAMSGWVELAQMRGYLSARTVWTVVVLVRKVEVEFRCAANSSGQIRMWAWPNKNAADMTRPRTEWR